MKIKQMLHDYVLIQVDPIEDTTSSGLFIAKESVKFPQTGTVLMVHKDSQFKPGQRVQFLRFSSLDGIDKDTKICKEEQVLAILE